MQSGLGSLKGSMRRSRRASMGERDLLASMPDSMRRSRRASALGAPGVDGEAMPQPQSRSRRVSTTLDDLLKPIAKKTAPPPPPGAATAGAGAKDANGQAALMASGAAALRCLLALAALAAPALTLTFACHVAAARRAACCLPACLPAPRFDCAGTYSSTETHAEPRRSIALPRLLCCAIEAPKRAT